MTDPFDVEALLAAGWTDPEEVEGDALELDGLQALALAWYLASNRCSGVA